MEQGRVFLKEVVGDSFHGLRPQHFFNPVQSFEWLSLGIEIGKEVKPRRRSKVSFWLLGKGESLGDAGQFRETTFVHGQ